MAVTQTPNSKHWFTTSCLQEGAGKRCRSARRHYALHDCQFLVQKTCGYKASFLYTLCSVIFLNKICNSKHVSVQHVKDDHFQKGGGGGGIRVINDFN